MQLTESHKEAMAEGRRQSHVIDRYLTNLGTVRPKRRGRKRTPDSIRRRLEVIERSLSSASAVKALSLLQEQDRLQAELKTLEAVPVLEDFEDEFVKVAREYGERKKITYAIWREVGVPADVLIRAGIGRASSSS